MKILSIVITYYPNEKDLLENIKQYIQYVDKLILWENTPSEDNIRSVGNFDQFYDKIIRMSTGKNEGISYPLNRAVEYGLSNGYTHLLTMDQDSYWTDFNLFISQINSMPENVLAFCPQVSGIYKLDSGNMDIKVMDECITSGSIYNLTLCKKLGPFREDFFIDAVDLEYCYRGIIHGYSTIMLSNGLLKHKLGNPIKIFNRWSITDYNDFRTFHIIRNHIWTWRIYPKIFSKKRFIIKQIILRSLHVIFSEDNKIIKLSAIFNALLAGLKKNINGSNINGNL